MAKQNHITVTSEEGITLSIDDVDGAVKVTVGDMTFTSHDLRTTLSVRAAFASAIRSAESRGAERSNGATVH